MLQITGIKTNVVHREFIPQAEFITKFQAAFEFFRAQGIRVSDIVVTAETFQGIRKAVSHNVIDLETRVANLNVGLLGLLYGARVWAKRECPDEEIKVYGQSDPQLAIDFPDIVAHIKTMGVKQL